MRKYLFFILLLLLNGCATPEPKDCYWLCPEETQDLDLNRCEWVCNN